MRLRYIAFFIIVFSTYILPQAEYVPYNHPVYDFLERMDVLHIISNYNSFEIPQTRRAIASHLSEVINHEREINNLDKQKLDDFKSEFEFELFGTQNSSTSLIGSTDYHFLSPKEKYFVKLADTSKFTLFVNISGDVEVLANRDLEGNSTKNAFFTRWGGALRGTILNKFGYYMKGTNGKFWGEKSIARSINELKFNYKFNADPNVLTATDYFDNTEGYITVDYDLVKFKLGRDQKQIGYGFYKSILDINTPQIDYFSFDINYKFISFSYFHGKLLGQSSIKIDPIQGEINTVSSKYMGYHRLAFNISKDFSIGAGEMIVYANRSIDLSYLNPFNFYKGTEHSNQDRDNSMLFFDFTNNSVRGLKLFGSILIDDIDFGKIGTGWFGNQLAYNFYLLSSFLSPVVPIDVKFQYMRVEPYVFTHRIYDNNYSNLGYSLVSPVQPNSEIFYLGISYYPHYRIGLNIDFTYSVHGANELNNDGTIRRNVGGDINTGHRNFDETKVYFLDGIHENLRNFSLSAVFEPVNNYFISGKLTYEKSDFRNSPGKFIAGYAFLNLRI